MTLSDTDLILEYQLKASVQKIWRAWSNETHLKEWFVPKPYQIKRAVIDLRGGGEFTVEILDPAGNAITPQIQRSFLLIEPNHRLIFTDFFGPAFTPQPAGFMLADITFTENANGTLYRALVRHKSAEDCKKHIDMGFFEGWGAVSAQLDAYAQTLE